jgi:hypothetical protein
VTTARNGIISMPSMTMQEAKEITRRLEPEQQNSSYRFQRRSAGKGEGAKFHSSKHA